MPSPLPTFPSLSPITCPHHPFCPVPPYQASYLNAASAWKNATSSREPSVSPASQRSVPVSDCPTTREAAREPAAKPIPPDAPGFIASPGPERRVESERALEAGCLWLSSGEGAWAISLGRWVLELSLGQLTCRGVLETSGPEDVHLCHLLGVAAQGAPAGAGGLVQAQLPGTGQRRRGARWWRGPGRWKVRGFKKRGRGNSRKLCKFSPDVARPGQAATGFLLLSLYCREPGPPGEKRQFTEHVRCAKLAAGMYRYYL